ncbi:hypothetical protein H4696_002042 [Amycolatopsis lexingtonensis]|uniref:ATP-binding protein n=1 Tax=Amycolatopsis lexingtonensis TaxID=218822 RepID=A0ABR9HVH7_9PSEU|nr:hypothetical protein [Amycolatopsis lexingtonensis]MBE1494942.1 hypothetical protein [Amycolatopsis lexingtonensis]
MITGLVVGGAVVVVALVTAVVLVRRRPRPRFVAGAVPHEPIAAVPRATLLPKIDETFRTGRFCVLLGRGGVGKTHVAAAYVRAARSPVVWVAAEDPAAPARAFAALARGSDTEAAAREGLAWLDGLDDALVVFDGATDPDALNRWLPARARVLVTTTVPDFEVLGPTLPVPAFTESEAVHFLRARSGRDTALTDVVRELGGLPLALAQAGGVLRSGGTLDRLQRIPPLERDPGEDHSPCVEDTTIAALRAVAARDSRAAAVAELLAVLGPPGVRLALVHRVGPDPVAVDAALAGLAAASLTESDLSGDVVTMHRLTRRAILGLLHTEDRLAAALDRAFAVVDGEDTGDLASHAAALWRHFRALPSAEAGPRLGPVLRLRRRSVDLLVGEGARGQARALGVEVLADHEAYLPTGHADTARAARSLHRAEEDRAAHGRHRRGP